MASVRKLKPEDPNSPWVCEYTDAAGKRRRITPKTGLKKDADAARRKIEAELERGDHVALSETITFSEAALTWLKDMSERARIGDNMTKSTVAMYDGSVQRVVDLLGNMKLTKIGVPEMQSAMDTLMERLAGVSVHHSYRTAFMVMEYAMEKKWIGTNPVSRKKMRLPAKNKTIAIPSDEDIKALLLAMSERGRYEHHHAYLYRPAIIMLALFGGLRRGEICGLRWQDVDFDRQVIRIRHSLSRLDGLKGPKTKAGRREIPIVWPVERALRALLVDRKMVADDHVIISRYGKPLGPTHVTSDCWYPLLKKAGLMAIGGKPRYRLHALRHTAVSLLIRQGLSPMHIKTMIGHASVSTTIDIYGHMFPNDAAISTAAHQVAAQFYATETRLLPASD